MSGFDDWYLYGDSLSRSLVAVTPEVGSLIFNDVMTRIASITPSTTSDKGQWYRALKGYYYIGPKGGDHHYQREMPEGISPGAILDANITLSSRLIREMDHFLSDVQAAGTGKPVQMSTRDGQSVKIQASRDDLARLHALVERLKRTRETCQPNYNQSVMSQIFAANLEQFQDTMATIGGQPQAAVDLVRAGAAKVLDLRWRFAADARLTALFFVQSKLCELALQQFDNGQLSAREVIRLAGMSFETKTVAHDPEQMLAQIVIDFAGAGLGDLVINLCDEALMSAEHEVDEALNAVDLPAHAGHLYSAAHFAFACMRLAEVFRELVAIDARPTYATNNLLAGYSRKAEEIVVRVSHALVIDCINRGSGEILKLHISQVQDTRQAGGPEKAQAIVNELINYFYFYPRYYVKELIGEGS